MFDFALNKFHVRLAKNQNVDEKDVDAIKCQSDEKHVRNCDSKEADISDWMVGKLEAIAAENESVT